MNLIQKFRYFLNLIDYHKAIMDSSCLNLITENTRICLTSPSYPCIEK